MNYLLFEVNLNKILGLFIIILFIYYFNTNINSIDITSNKNNQDSKIHNTVSAIHNIDTSDAIDINNTATIINSTDITNNSKNIINNKLFYTKVKPILNKNINYAIINNTDHSGNFSEDNILNLNTLEQNLQSINIDYTNIKKELNYENNNYKLLGSAINKYYNQYYLVYGIRYIDSELSCLPFQSLFNTDNCDIKDTNYANNKLYNYLLVNIDHKNNLYKIKYKIGPRSKIQNNEYIYIGSGYLQFGPFYFQKNI